MSLIDFTTNPATLEQSVAIEGIVTKVPASTSDLLHVSIPSFDDQQSFGPCPWPPNGDVLPHVGQRVLVILSDQQAPWAFPAWQ